MALTELVAADLIPRLKPGQKIASMGYPDIVSPEETVLKWLGKREIEYRTDAEKICKWHGLKPQRIPDAKSFFKAFGCELTVFDIVQARGDEVIADLNIAWSPGPETDYARFDYVLDVGTLEHCFNAGQAIKNMASLLRAGGTIYHGNPFQMGNHGFYSLNPTFYADFYTQPGFELLWVKMQQPKHAEVREPPLTDRFHYEGGEMNIFAAAKRIEVLSIEYPVQTKYRSAK